MIGIDACIVRTRAVLAARRVDKRVSVNEPANFTQEDCHPEEVDLHLEQSWVRTLLPHVEQDAGADKFKGNNTVVHCQPH